MSAEPFDRQTNREIYIGRMVVELMKKHTQVIISEAGVTMGNIRFEINHFGDNRVCLEKSHMDLGLMDRPLNQANYDSEDMLRHMEKNNE